MHFVLDSLVSYSWDYHTMGLNCIKFSHRYRVPYNGTHLYEFIFNETIGSTIEALYTFEMLIVCLST